MNTRTRRTLAALLLAPAMVLFAGCAAGTSGSSGADQPKSEAELNATVASCLRDKGFDVSDSITDADLKTITDGGEAALQALQKCSEAAGPAPGDSGAQGFTDQEAQAYNLKAAQCFRDAGFDVEDPRPGQSLRILEGIPDSLIEKCAP